MAMRTLIIGVGNPQRGDDGVGICVVRRLAESHPRIATFSEASGEGAALIDCWQGYDEVILIDAVAPGELAGPPGHLHTLDVRRHALPSSFFHYSTHAFSVAEAVELARVLDLLPPLMTVYGLVGVSFGAGQLLSPPVARAADLLTAELIRAFATRAQ